MSDQEEERNQPSKLGSTATLKGEWVCDEDVIVEGELQGIIDSRNHDLLIERGAIVKAELRGNNITVLGKVTGNITAAGKIKVGKEARITGDLSAPQISIREGAKFKGIVKMVSKTH